MSHQQQRQADVLSPCKFTRGGAFLFLRCGAAIYHALRHGYNALRGAAEAVGFGGGWFIHVCRIFLVGFVMMIANAKSSGMERIISQAKVGEPLLCECVPVMHRAVEIQSAFILVSFIDNCCPWHTPVGSEKKFEINGSWTMRHDCSFASYYWRFCFVFFRQRPRRVYPWKFFPSINHFKIISGRLACIDNCESKVIGWYLCRNVIFFLNTCVHSDIGAHLSFRGLCGIPQGADQKRALEPIEDRSNNPDSYQPLLSPKIRTIERDFFLSVVGNLLGFFLCLWGGLKIYGNRRFYGYFLIGFGGLIAGFGQFNLLCGPFF